MAKAHLRRATAPAVTSTFASLGSEENRAHPARSTGCFFPVTRVTTDVVKLSASVQTISRTAVRAQPPELGDCGVGVGTAGAVLPLSAVVAVGVDIAEFEYSQATA